MELGKLLREAGRGAGLDDVEELGVGVVDLGQFGQQAQEGGEGLFGI